MIGEFCSCGWRWLLSVSLFMSGIFWPVAMADGTEPQMYDQLALAGARIAWRVTLPLRMTASIKSYHLVEGYIYAIGVDGKVRTVRADTGDHIWTKPLAEPFETLWPPVSYHDSEMDAVVFTRIGDVLFLDSKTGEELKRYKLRAPTVGAVAVSGDTIYAAVVGARVYNYSISRQIPLWQLSTTAPINLAPICKSDQADKDQLFVADSKGQVASVSGETKKLRFAQKIDGEPRGWLTTDTDRLYVATADGSLHVLDRRTGDPIRRSIHLSKPPDGGPVVTADAVYQAVEGGGLYRLPLKSDSSVRFDARSKRFLADWPHHIVQLRTDGKIALVNRRAGKESVVLDIGEVADGISNLWNEAVIVYSAQGELRCLQPIGSKSLTLADFKPAKAVPETKPAVQQPDQEVEKEASPSE
ncbi:MAG: PQQ-binding-like beta-propeller repeat protein [Planctomycetota bacterium]|nr:MAG: PQQ-binding-like beta-propeller repeat protein [Planctomycetota bacterium]